ncbi:MAG: hypothetical protein Q8L39_14155 [Burkholderiales bacterium]|nr:hypothetical protein [Burkholderiales bacterium]
MNMRLNLKVLILALCLSGMGSSFAAGDNTTLTTQSDTMDQLTSTQSAPKVTSKFATDFSTFVGSQEDAAAIITGLRNGTPITLAGTTITPPTKPMGYGNTYISMSLAKAQLAQYGITEPTPEQLNTALTGGTLTATTVAADGTVVTKTVTLDGILTQRASGMGWGQIAKANGFKLGQVISGMKSANKSMAPTPTPTATSASSTTAAASKTGNGSIKNASTSTEAKIKHPASSRSITTAVSGGGIIYGNRSDKASAQLASIGSHSASDAAHGQGIGISNAAGGAGSVASNGKSGSAPGQNKTGK